MQTTEILQEIQRMPLNKRLFMLEEILKSIKKDELTRQLEFAVQELQEDYKTDPELTSFTSLDLEQFYEAR